MYIVHRTAVAKNRTLMPVLCEVEREPNHLLPDHDLRPTYALIEVSQCGRRDFAYQDEE